MSEYYTPTGYPITLSQGASKQLRDEFVLIEEMSDKLPTLSGNGSKPVFINSAGTGMESVSGAVAIANMGISASIAELNYMDGVTSNVQTQLNSIAALPGNVVLQSTSTDTGDAGDLYAVFDSTNTAFGHQSLYSVTDGIRNTSVGKSAADAITTGNNNVAIGMNALSAITNTDDNVAIGQGCATAATGISQCVIIGSSADVSNSITNSIVIGYDAQSLGSNTVSIGNSSITLTRLRGNVVIGGSVQPDGGATNTLGLYSGTAPTGAVNDSIALYSSDLSAGNTMLSLWTEGTPVASVSPTSPDRTLALRVNGTVYYLHAKTTND